MIDIDPRYQRGKIYKIVGSGMKYYGSTILTLNARLKIHETDYKRWLEGKYGYCKSFDIISKGDYEIKLVRLYPCNNKPELDRKEGKYILKNECINKKVSGRTHKESTKAYYESNREKVLKQQKEYYETNKEMIRKYQNTVISCYCGRTYTRSNKGQHERTQFHKTSIL